MSFLLKLLLVWLLVSVPLGILIGRALRMGDRRAAAAHGAESEAPTAPETPARRAG
jgi:hypothetical protein